MRIKIFQAVMPEFARSEVGTPALAGSRLWIFRLLIIIAAFWLLIIIAAWFCCRMLMSSPRYLSLGLNVVVAVLIEPDHGHVQGSTLGVDKDKVALSPR